MKVLVLLSEGFDTPGPSNHLIEAMVEDMLDSGIEVELVESRRDLGRDPLPECLRGRAGFRFHTVKRYVIPKRRFILRYLEEALYAIRCSSTWISIRGNDAVFVQSSPTAIISILLLRLFKRARIVYSIQDVFPDSAVSSGVLKSRSVAFLFDRIQRIAYKLAWRIVVISEDMKQKLLTKGVTGRKIEVIYNWYDDRTIAEVQRADNRFIKKYGLSPGVFYVQYAGTLGYVHDFFSVILAARELSDIEDIVFQFVGEGSQKADMLRMTAEMRLRNVVFLGREPQEMMPDVYSACNVCVIPLKRGIIGNSVPSKAAIVMACGRPLISTADTDSFYYSMHKEFGIGIAVEPGNVSSLVAAITQLYENRALARDMGRNAFDYSRGHFSRTKNTRKYLDLFST